MNYWSSILVCGLVLCLKEIKANEDDFHCPEEYHYEVNNQETISSPFYGKEMEYRKDLQCRYRITAPKGYKIKLIFQDFDLNPSLFCSMDLLKVSDESFLGSENTFCGNKLPTPILSRKNELILYFNTGYEFTSGRRGFSLQAIATLNDSLCDMGFLECGNRNCYERSKKCDGIDDCGDGTDEENCGLPISATECGLPPITPNTGDSSLDRMVGGEVAKPHSWPWQISLRVKTFSHSHFCGGTVLNSLWVLSAGHCFLSYNDPDIVEVHFGSHNKREESSFYQIRAVEKIIVYPDLDRRNITKFSLNDDVALVKLKAQIQFTDGVQPACLPEQGSELNIGDECFTSGWGETRGSGSDKLLKQTKQVVVTESECNSEKYNPKTQICVRNYRNTPCVGDSGGPLVCKKGDGRWYVFGATSLSTQVNLVAALCATPDTNFLFSKISDKANWIKSTIEKNTLI